MSIFDDAALSFISSRGMVVEGYKRRCTRPDGTVHELYIDRLRLDGSPRGLEALSSLLSETENNRYLTAGKTEQVISASTDTNSPPLLTEYLELFLQRKEGGNKDITEQTVQEYQRVVSLFIEIFGDLPVNQYTEKNAVNFRAKMRLLPPYVRSRLPWKAMSIEQVLNSDEVTVTRSPKRIEGHLKRMNAIFKDLAERRLIKFNFFKDVHIKTTSRHTYRPFKVDELGVIFASGNIQVNPIWPSHYWVPLLALYTGMRRSEIFFRSPSDILRESDIDFINVHREGDKNTKNESSVRKIPIHSHLIKLGFLKYVEQVRYQHGDEARLFREYKDHKGQAGNKFTDWFREYRRSIGINEPGKVFHSFRSNFINELERHDENSYMIQRIAGHAIQSITHHPVKGYGGKFDLKDLKDLKATIEKVDFYNVLIDLPGWCFD